MIVCVIPVFDEAQTLDAVLDFAARWAQRIVAVDDGSGDGSPALLRAWAARHPGVLTVLSTGRRAGMSAALKLGLEYVATGLADRSLRDADMVVTLDADGQYADADLGSLCAALQTGGLDMLVVARDFSCYPWFKRSGNRLMSLWASLLTGRRIADAEAGLRVMRAEVVPKLLPYFRGWRYSCAQELLAIAVRLGLKVGNDYPQRLAHARSRTRLSDAFINAFMGASVALRTPRR